MPHAEGTGFATLPREIRRLDLLDRARAVSGHGRRYAAVREGALDLRRLLANGPRCVAVRSLPLTRLIYPTKYAFQGAAFSPAPFVVMTHRALLVQYQSEGALRTLLFNPTDVEGARATPFFAKVIAATPKFAEEILAPRFPTLEAQLATFGITTEDVDYVAFDHFHTQDLRRLLGGSGRPARFPNAKLLAPRAEWEDWDRLHPMQRAWFVEGGKDGVDRSRVVLTDGDLLVGDGVALIRTPGHTSGNQTLFVSTSSGIWGCAENGTCADNWSPLDSKIAGLRRHAKAYDVDLVMNMNTPEWGADQYTSMNLERTVVDRVAHAPAFVQMFPSSEVTPSAIAPGLAPTIVFGELASGEPVGKRTRTVSAATAANPA
jgi:glyoxylase-like metal-dependent hydrolase (beta-lactamase superfamily II)